MGGWTPDGPLARLRAGVAGLPIPFSQVNYKIETGERELFGPSSHHMNVSVRSKWWPLPSHSPSPTPKSKFSFPKVAMVKVLYCNSEPPSETTWLESFDVPLSERIANRGEWHNLLQ